MAGEYIVNTSTALGYDFDYYAGGVKSRKVTRCKDCQDYVEEGYISLGQNAAMKPACDFLSNWDSENDWTEWFYVKPNDYCAWAKPRFSISEADMDRMGKTYGRIYEKAKESLPTIGYGEYPSESQTGS